ncbi:MAG: flagellar hook-length control protein FliK [Thioalkalivibrionaceae bacterium]
MTANALVNTLLNGNRSPKTDDTLRARQTTQPPVGNDQFSRLFDLAPRRTPAQSPDSPVAQPPSQRSTASTVADTERGATQRVNSSQSSPESSRANRTESTADAGVASVSTSLQRAWEQASPEQRADALRQAFPEIDGDATAFSLVAAYDDAALAIDHLRQWFAGGEMQPGVIPRSITDQLGLTAESITDIETAHWIDPERIAAPREWIDGREPSDQSLLAGLNRAARALAALEDAAGLTGGGPRAFANFSDAGSSGEGIASLLGDGYALKGQLPDSRRGDTLLDWTRLPGVGRDLIAARLDTLAPINAPPSGTTESAPRWLPAAAGGDAQTRALDVSRLLGSAEALTRQSVDPGLARGLVERMRMLVGSGGGMAEVRLHPPQLGSIDLKVHVEGDRVHVQFLTTQPVTRDLLETHLPRLRDTLEQGGLMLGDTSVGYREAGQQTDSQNGERGDGLAKNATDSAASDADDNPGGDDRTRPATLDRLRGRLDLFA